MNFADNLEWHKISDEFEFLARSHYNNNDNNNNFYILGG